MMGAEIRVRLWAQIETEFGEPVADVITGLREMGNSWRTVAGALGVTHPTLLLWRKALGLPENKNHKVYDPSSRPEYTTIDEKARRLGYSDATEAVADLRLKQKLTLKEAARILDCHYQTVARYSLPGVRNTVNLSEDGRRRRIRNLSKQWQGAKPDDNHPWREDNTVIFTKGLRR